MNDLQIVEEALGNIDSSLKSNAEGFLYAYNTCKTNGEDPEKLSLMFEESIQDLIKNSEGKIKDIVSAYILIIYCDQDDKNNVEEKVNIMIANIFMKAACVHNILKYNI